VWYYFVEINHLETRPGMDATPPLGNRDTSSCSRRRTIILENRRSSYSQRRRSYYSEVAIRTIGEDPTTPMTGDTHDR